MHSETGARRAWSPGPTEATRKDISLPAALEHERVEAGADALLMPAQGRRWAWVTRSYQFESEEETSIYTYL